MKKIFMLVLTVFFSLSLFAETGYKGVEWGWSEEKCSENVSLKMSIEDSIACIGISQDTPDTDVEARIENISILGKKNKVIYLFLDNILMSTTYMINQNQLNELKNKLNETRRYKTMRQFTELKHFFFSEETWKKPDINVQELDNSIARLMCAYAAIEYEFGSGEDSTLFTTFELEPPTEKNKKYPGTLTLYDYNDDTRVYIYDNIIKDKAVVVYVPHEQDY